MLAQVTNILRALLRHPRQFYWNLQQYSNESQWAYIAETKLRLDERVREIEFLELITPTVSRLENITFRPHGSTVPDYVLLVELCNQFRNCDYFEIGTFLGESLSNVASVCRKCMSLSLGDEQYASPMMSKEDARRVSRMFSRNIPNVKHLYADSRTFDFNSIEERFDVIFVDGGHDYDCVKSDTKNALSLLKNEDSICVFHDAKNVYNNLEPEVMCGIYAGLPEKFRSCLYTVENTMCAIFRKREYRSIRRVDLRSSPYASPKIAFGLESRIVRL